MTIEPTEPIPCAEALDLLEPWLDGDLPPEEAGRLRSHLAGCSSCSAELALAERIQRELRALPQPDCPPEVIEKVVRSGRGAVVPFPAHPWRARIAAAAALVALAVGAGALFVHVQQQRDQQVARATAEARLALAYLGRATRKTGLDVRDEVLEKRLVIPAARSVSRSLGAIAGPVGEPRKELR